MSRYRDDRDYYDRYDRDRDRDRRYSSSDRDRDRGRDDRRSGGRSTRVYVGKISGRTRERDLDDLFSRYGRVISLDLKHGYAFVEYDNPRDADDACRKLDKYELDGSRLTVEMSHGGAGYRGPAPGTGKCFNCGKEGHWARECSYGDGRDRCYTCGESGHIARECRQRPKSRSPSRSKSRSKSPRRRRDSRSKSRSPSRGRSPRKSRSSESPQKAKVEEKGDRSPAAEEKDAGSPDRAEKRSRSPSPKQEGGDSPSPKRQRADDDE
mmetsp:Transcript_26503/g.45651  ORF Transcript_26503/g.45651 Transcript_26503/m.45651 type:complete len:266 (+) Transcript_26503:58-855(+)